MFYICYRGQKLYGPLTEAEAVKEWFALSGTVNGLYVVEIDEATGRTKRQIGPVVRKRKK